MVPDRITRVFNAFDPHEALRPGDSRYVECSVERGSVGLLNTLARTIRRSSGCTVQFLSGHRGSGKTTELFRLQQDLVANQPRHFVVYCEAEQYIDLNDVEYTDVLLGVVQQLWADAQRENLVLDPGKFAAIVEDLKGILTTPVDMKGLDVQASFVKLGFEMKKNPNNRQLVREHLKPRATTFVEAVNEVIENAGQSLRAKGYAGLVVIVDNLDRVFRNPLAGAGRTSHEALFVDSGDHLRSVACDVIYTVPPALLHSAHGTRLPSLYGTTPQMLPMIPVTTRTGEVNAPGRAKLIEAIEKRLLVAGCTLADAFDAEQTLHRLCATSGGYVRSLMTLVRSATNFVDDLPLPAAAVEQTIRDARDAFVRTVHSPRQWQLLRDVARTRQIGETEDYLQLLENFAVLEYRDADGPWYDANSVLREAREFRE